MKKGFTKTPAADYKGATCSLDAFRRGRGQKIVSFAFYGDFNSEQAVERGYFEGIADNLNLIPVYYPGMYSFTIMYIEVKKYQPTVLKRA